MAEIYVNIYGTFSNGDTGRDRYSVEQVGTTVTAEAREKHDGGLMGNISWS